MIQGDGRNAGAMPELVIGMNSLYKQVGRQSMWAPRLLMGRHAGGSLWRSLLMAESEEGEKVSHRTEGD